MALFLCFRAVANGPHCRRIMKVDAGPTPQARNSSALVCDFDGTLTRHDFYRLVQTRWWRPDEPNPWNDYLAGRLTHFDALNRIFARVRGNEASLKAFIDTMELDPTVPAAFEELHAAGWTLIIASAGCQWYMGHLLSGVKAPFTLHANPGRYSPGRGLQMIPPVESRFFNAPTGIDKVAVVRDALARHARVAFAGDGPPDLPAAMLVAGQRRFGRGYLAEALAAQKEAFNPLTDLAAVARQLLKEEPL